MNEVLRIGKAASEMHITVQGYISTERMLSYIRFWQDDKIQKS